jgi:hypothetical protein
MQQAFLRGLLLFLCAAGATTAGVACGGDNTTGGTSTGGPACPESLAKVPNSEFCAKDAISPINCDGVTDAYTKEVCGVPLKDSTADLKRSASVKEFGGSGPPKVGCFAPSGYPAKSDPTKSKNVQLTGTVKIFSHGCESKLVKIEVFEVNPDGTKGAAVGNALTTAANCQMNGVATTNTDCGMRYECNYIYAGVPTDKELVVKTSGDLWAELYEYNVYIDDAAVMNGGYKHDLRALASDDYNVISQAAIGAPITAGNGAVAGEVHDCGDVRLSNATVDIDKPKKVLTYFTSAEDHPLPDMAARATSTLGLYAALDVPPGPITVAAMGQLSGAKTAVGFHKAQVFPNAVTVVTFRGVEPFQVP